MLRKDVRIGETYFHKHRRVRITNDLGLVRRRQYGRQGFRELHSGWSAINLATGREVHVKSAAGLRAIVDRTPKASTVLPPTAAGNMADFDTVELTPEEKRGLMDGAETGEEESTHGDAHFKGSVPGAPVIMGTLPGKLELSTEEAEEEEEEEEGERWDGMS